jgi:hypothetical protein
MAGKAKRTTHRAWRERSPHAVRDKQGRFKDIQTYGAPIAPTSSEKRRTK